VLQYKLEATASRFSSIDAAENVNAVDVLVQSQVELLQSFSGDLSNNSSDSSTSLQTVIVSVVDDRHLQLCICLFFMCGVTTGFIEVSFNTV